MELTLYSHDTCPNSQKFIKLLKEIKVYDYINVINTAEKSFDSYQKGLLSVPALFLDEQLIVSGLFDETWIKSHFQLYSTELPSNEVIFKKYISAILDNVATGSSIFLYEDHSRILDNKNYILVTTGLNKIIVKDNNSIIDKIKQIIQDRFTTFFKEKQSLFLKSISINFLREVHWLENEISSLEYILEKYNETSLKHWLYTRATLGRIGIEPNIDSKMLRTKSLLVWNYLQENFIELKELAIKTS